MAGGSGVDVWRVGVDGASLLRDASEAYRDVASAAVACVLAAASLSGAPVSASVKVAAGRYGYLSVAVRGAGPDDEAIRRFCTPSFARPGPAAALALGKTMILDAVTGGVRRRRSLTSEAVEAAAARSEDPVMASIVEGAAVEADGGDGVTLTVNRLHAPIREEDVAAVRTALSAVSAGLPVATEVNGEPLATVAGRSGETDRGLSRVEEEISNLFSGFLARRPGRRSRVKGRPGAVRRSSAKRQSGVKFRFGAVKGTDEPYVIRKGSRLVRINTRSPFVAGLVRQGFGAPGSLRALMSLSAQAVAQLEVPRKVAAEFGRKKDVPPAEVAGAAAKASRELYAAALNHVSQAMEDGR